MEADLNFFLRQVDPLFVAKSYIAKTLLLPKEKFKFDDITLTQDLVVGNSPDSSAYEYIDKNGSKLRIITGNHLNWSSETLKENFVCHGCRIRYHIQGTKSALLSENLTKIVNCALLLPVQIEKVDDKLIFHGTGEYCCFECAFADLKTKCYTGFYYKDSVYSDSEGLLRYMYYLFTGKENLTASPPWTEHIDNGGNLPDKDFYNKNYTYGLLPNVILKHAKVAYIRSEK